MIKAILVCSLGCAEGATLSCRFGGWQVISWALLLSTPATAAIALFNWPRYLEQRRHLHLGLPMHADHPQRVQYSRPFTVLIPDGPTYGSTALAL